MGKREKTLIVLFAMIMALFVGTFSYGFFAVTVGNANRQEASIETGTMKLTFADENNGFSKALNLGESVTKTFTIENTGTLETTASMYFKDLINDYIEGSLTYTLEYAISENGTYTAVKTNVNLPRSITQTEELIYGRITIPAGAKYYYKLTITFNDLENINQSDDLDAVMNTKFTLKAGHTTTGKYLYNGRELQDINEVWVDKENYPHALLLENLNTSLEASETKEYILILTDKAFFFDDGQWSNYTIPINTDYIIYLYKEQEGFSHLQSGITSSDEYEYVGIDEIMNNDKYWYYGEEVWGWTNTDILYDPLNHETRVFLEKSEPIPA